MAIDIYFSWAGHGDAHISICIAVLFGWSDAGNLHEDWHWQPETARFNMHLLFIVAAEV